jgi:hypothetical protein
MTQEYKILKGRTITTFTGDLLSQVSSQRDERQEHWTEYELYKTSSGKYIIVIYGKPKNPSKKTKINIIEAMTPHGVREALKFKNKDGNIYLTYTAELALKAAAENDEGLNEIYNSNDIT